MSAPEADGSFGMAALSTILGIGAELGAKVHGDLVAYGEALGQDGGKSIEPIKLIPPILSRFMSTDRALARLKREPAANESDKFR